MLASDGSFTRSEEVKTNRNISKLLAWRCSHHCAQVQHDVGHVFTKCTSNVVVDSVNLIFTWFLRKVCHVSSSTVIFCRVSFSAPTRSCGVTCLAVNNTSLNWIGMSSQAPGMNGALFFIPAPTTDMRYAAQVFFFVVFLNRGYGWGAARRCG